MTLALAGASLKAITRSLEERSIPTKLGKKLWDYGHIRHMLQSHTYVGTRYYHQVTKQKLPPTSDGAPRKKRSNYVYRDETEWIGVKVPAIVSPELFERVQKRIRETNRGYRKPNTQFLLRSLVHCGECGCKFHSYRRYIKTTMVSGKQRVHHKAAYRCNWRNQAHAHCRDHIVTCHNPEVATHLLDEKVFELIREFMLDPVKLRPCIRQIGITARGRPATRGNRRAYDSNRGRTNAPHRPVCIG